MLSREWRPTLIAESGGMTVLGDAVSPPTAFETIVIIDQLR